jgi:hypothetical protein
MSERNVSCRRTHTSISEEVHAGVLLSRPKVELIVCCLAASRLVPESGRTEKVGAAFSQSRHGFAAP